MKLKKGVKVLMHGWWRLVQRKVKGLYENFVGERFAHIGGTLYNVADLKEKIFTEVEEVELKKDNVDTRIQAEGQKTVE